MNFNYWMLAMIGGLIIGAALLAAMSAFHRRFVTPTKHEFRHPLLTLSVDDAKQELVITRKGDINVTRLPLGTLRWTSDRISNNEFSGPAVPENWSGHSWLTVQSLSPAAALDPKWNQFGLMGLDVRMVAESVRISVPDGVAEDALRWLNHREARFHPDVVGRKRALQQAGDKLLADCRKALEETPAVESFTYWYDNTISYVAVFDDGRAVAVDGDVPVLIPITQLRASHDGRLRVMLQGGHERRFALDAKATTALQKLQQRGVVRLLPPLPQDA